MKKACEGIWTPWAKVICYECHGNTFERGFRETVVLTDKEMEEYNTPTDLNEEFNKITKCQTCGKEIQINESIAIENNVALDLKEQGYNAYMVQLGGMMDGMQIDINDTDFYRLTYNMDGYNDYLINHMHWDEEEQEEIWIENDSYVFYSEEDFNSWIKDTKNTFKKIEEVN